MLNKAVYVNGRITIFSVLLMFAVALSQQSWGSHDHTTATSSPTPFASGGGEDPIPWPWQACSAPWTKVQGDWQFVMYDKLYFYRLILVRTYDPPHRHLFSIELFSSEGLLLATGRAAVPVARKPLNVELRFHNQYSQVTRMNISIRSYLPIAAQNHPGRQVNRIPQCNNSDKFITGFYIKDLCYKTKDGQHRCSSISESQIYIMEKM